MREEIKNIISGASDDQIDLGEMEIKDDEMAEIMQFIVQSRPQLKALFLNNNLISDTGAKAISLGLPSLKQLSRLDLQANQIGKEGLQAIYSLKNEETKLAIHGNKIGDNAVLEEIKKAAFRK